MYNKKGFTLIEIVATLVILGITLVSIVSLFSYGTRAMTLNKQNTIATMLLQKKYEELKSTKFDNIINVSGATYSTFPDYSIDINVQSSYGGNPFLKKVEIRITWLSNFGSNISKSILTFISNHL